MNLKDDIAKQDGNSILRRTIFRLILLVVDGMTCMIETLRNVFIWIVHGR